MNEHEFRDALRASMSVTAEPPPMTETPVLETARRARSRRRALWAGAGSAAAVAAIAAGVVIVASSTSGEEPGLNVGVPTTDTTARATSDEASEPADTDRQTETSWPNGQTDRTATSGPRADQGEALINELSAVVPDGYETPRDLKGNGVLSGAPMWYPQAQYVETVDDVEVWEYLADIPVTQGDRVGRLEATVLTPGDQRAYGCDQLAPGTGNDCTEVEVDGKRVTVITIADKEMGQFDTIATYRHEDGTRVSIAQATFRAFTDFPTLSKPIFTTERLAELATDPRFLLD